MEYSSIPALPVERFDPQIVVGSELQAWRNSPPDRAADRPDTILVSAPPASFAGSVTMYLPPAMLVHMANTLLTDNERAAILAPAIAGADTE